MLEGLPYTRASPVQQHALVGLRELQGLADLLGRPALEVAQDDDLLLARRKPADGSVDVFERLARQQPLLGQRVPVGRKSRPSARILAVRALETLGGDPRLVVALGRERREGHAPSLFDGSRARAVGEDAEHPGAQTRAALEARQGTQD